MEDDEFPSDIETLETSLKMLEGTDKRTPTTMTIGFYRWLIRLALKTLEDEKS